MSIELSLEDVKKVAYHYGFVMEVRFYALNLRVFFMEVLFSWVILIYDLQVEKMIETTYTANMRAMMHVSFQFNISK
jgi:hypothetical protein